MFRAANTDNLLRRPGGAESLSQRSIFTAWLAVTGALIMVATLVSLDPSTGLALNQAEAGPIDLASPVAVATATGNSDSIVYGSLEWTLIETRLVPRDNHSFSKPVVILEMVARNLDGEHQARARRRDMVLILEDGTRAPMDRFEHTPSTYRIAVDPGQAMPVTLVFKPVVTRDPWLDDLALEIAEENRRPARLPLNGSPTPDGYPMLASVDPTADKVSVKAGRSEVNVTLVAANIDIDAGQYRARQDEELIVIQVAVDGGSPVGESSIGSALPPWAVRNFWQLTTDNGDAAESVDPHHVSPLPLPGGDPGSARSGYQLVFAIPADLDTSTMIMSAGSQKVKIGSIRRSVVAN